MVHYQIYGNAAPEDFLGGKENVELMLKSLNIAKTIALELGKEYNPPLVWNDNLPLEFVEPLSDKVITELKKNKLWKPTEKDKDKLRAQLKKIVGGK